MDEGTCLSTGTVHSEWDAHRTLHQEPVQDCSVITIVIEAVDKTFVKDGLGCVCSPDDTLVQVCDTELVVLLVELPQNSIKTFGGMVDRPGVGRVQDVRFTSTGQNDVDVTFWDFSTGRTVPVDAHGTEMDDVCIDVSIDDGTAQVVGPTYVVVDRVPLALRILHRIRCGTLFGEVDDRIRLFRLDQIDKQVIFFGDVHIDELDVLSGHFLPCLDTSLRTCDGCQRVATQIQIDLSTAQVVNDDDIMSSVGQVKGGRPSAEPVTTQDDDLLLLVGTINISIGSHGQCCRNLWLLQLLRSKCHDTRRGACNGQKECSHDHLCTMPWSLAYLSVCGG
mmetsp:Transcript_59639/g.146209  ORF Transcript_59639/g.146209 Transcript_59639/m.146209 type:complete len:335 (-) Transcript_59639:170-1174(-)